MAGRCRHVRMVMCKGQLCTMRWAPHIALTAAAVSKVLPEPPEQSACTAVSVAAAAEAPPAVATPAASTGEFENFCFWMFSLNLPEKRTNLGSNTRELELESASVLEAKQGVETAK